MIGLRYRRIQILEHCHERSRIVTPDNECIEAMSACFNELKLSFGAWIFVINTTLIHLVDSV